MIAFYYGLTGFACAIYYRRELTRSVKSFVLIGVAPLLGGLILTARLHQVVHRLADPANSESGDSWLGIGPPLIIGLGFLVMGVGPDAVVAVCRARRVLPAQAGGRRPRAWPRRPREATR